MTKQVWLNLLANALKYTRKQPRPSHGGRVWAEGKVGAGAVFSFALPTHRDA